MKTYKHGDNEIILRQEGGDTFIGEEAHIIMHGMNGAKCLDYESRSNFMAGYMTVKKGWKII